MSLQRTGTVSETDAIRKKFNVETEVRPVRGAPGYFVSADGRVFSGLHCSWTKERPRECKPITTKYGYKMFRLHINKKPTAENVHRMVAFAFLPEPKEDQTVVRHLDGDPANNRVGNLAWGTQAENMADCVRHGRSLKGLRNPVAKLNDDTVRAIRILIGQGYSSNALAAFLGVADETIRRAVSGEHWGHVDAA